MLIKVNSANKRSCGKNLNKPENVFCMIVINGAAQCSFSASNLPSISESKNLKAVAKNGAKQTISSFTELFDELAECQWYWGGISAGTASRLLQRRSPGTFLVRDSRSDRSIFSFSYATASGVYHSRIYRFNGYFCLGGPNALIRSPSLRDFVLQTVARSSVDSGETNCKKTGLSATTASRNAELPLRILMHPSSAEPTAQPVDIRVPLCRNNFVPTLRGACRLAIRRSISDCSRIEELPIPKKLKKFLFSSDYLLSFSI